MRSLSKVARVAVLGLAVAALAVPVRAADLDDLAPASAEAVLVIDLKALLESKAFKKSGEDMVKQAVQPPKTAAFVKAAGVDPLKDLAQVTVTISGKIADPKVGVVVRGKFDVARLQKAVEDFAAKEDDKVKIMRDGGATYFTRPAGPAGQQVTATFVGPGVFVLSNDTDHVKRIAAGKKSKPSLVLREVLAKVDGKASAYVAIVATDELKKVLAEIPIPDPLNGGRPAPLLMGVAPTLEAAAAALTVSDDLDFAFTIHATNEATPKYLRQLAQLGVAQLKQAGEANPVVDDLLKNVLIRADGTAFNVKLRLTEDLLKKLQPGGE